MLLFLRSSISAVVFPFSPPFLDEGWGKKEGVQLIRTSYTLALQNKVLTKKLKPEFLIDGSLHI